MLHSTGLWKALTYAFPHHQQRSESKEDERKEAGFRGRDGPGDTVCHRTESVMREIYANDCRASINEAGTGNGKGIVGGAYWGRGKEETRQLRRHRRQPVVINAVVDKPCRAKRLSRPGWVGECEREDWCISAHGQGSGVIGKGAGESVARL